MKHFHVAAILIAALGLAAPATAQERDLEPPSAEILTWSPPRQVAGYRAIDRLSPTREVSRGTLAYPLLPDLRDWSTFRYRFQDRELTVDDYIREMRVAGVIALKGDRVLLERYALGNDASSRWLSFSVTKSVTSMLIGAAIQDGYIESVDDRVVDYLPRLKGSAYDEVTIRQVLQMASGVGWNEDYTDETSDLSRAPLGSVALFDYMRGLPAEAAPGKRFNYSTGETNVAGALLRAAIGNNLSVYLEDKIWRPFGMESDAAWTLDRPRGEELGGCCLNATLRDYARIGRFAVRDGVLPDGTRVLPEGWMTQSTTPSPAADQYGYYWWLLGGGTYAAIGIFGQTIWIDPQRDIVIAMHSAWPEATGRELSRHRMAFLASLAEALAEP
ncbi:beta-lactamase [Acidobacteria bacterium Mor1]|nr:beta-lactamase [Acidobacteria bacterium Mor1]